MNTAAPAVALKRRFSAIFLGIALLIWFSIEDTTENPALIFAIWISIWLAAARLRRTPRALPQFILAGLFAGAAVTPLALTLMAIKTGLHAHPTPDYTLQQMRALLYRTPIWIIGGFLSGLGGGLLHREQRGQAEDHHAVEC